MLPAVKLHPVLVLVAVPVVGGPGGRAHTIGVETGIEWAAVFQVKFMDFCIEPVDLFKLVMVVLWFRAIVSIPNELWGVH